MHYWIISQSLTGFQKFARLIETVEASEKEMQAEHLAMISELEAAEGELAEEEASSKVNGGTSPKTVRNSIIATLISASSASGA